MCAPCYELPSNISTMVNDFERFLAMLLNKPAIGAIRCLRFSEVGGGAYFFDTINFLDYHQWFLFVVYFFMVIPIPLV